jgi:hypothetical protein
MFDYHRVVSVANYSVKFIDINHESQTISIEVMFTNLALLGLGGPRRI